MKFRARRKKKKINRVFHHFDVLYSGALLLTVFVTLRSNHMNLFFYSLLNKYRDMEKEATHFTLLNNSEEMFNNKKKNRRVLTLLRAAERD